MKSENQEEQIISFNLFNSIMKCTNLPGYYPVDEMSSILTFGFWYTLQVKKYIFIYRTRQQFLNYIGKYLSSVQHCNS